MFFFRFITKLSIIIFTVAFFFFTTTFLANYFLFPYRCNRDKAVYPKLSSDLMGASESSIEKSSQFFLCLHACMCLESIKLWSESLTSFFSFSFSKENECYCTVTHAVEKVMLFICSKVSAGMEFLISYFFCSGDIFPSMASSSNLEKRARKLQ